MPRKTSPVDDIWALFQTRTVRDIARKLRVDRRTVQRWKNQGQQPIKTNERKIHVAASRDRTQMRALARSPRERQGVAPLAVPLFGKRQYVTEEIKPTRSVAENRKAWEAERVRSREAKRVYDRFYKRKDARGRTRFYRSQDGRAVTFDLRRAREADILTLLKSFKGQERAIVMIHALTKPYERKTGEILPKGAHLASVPESLDALDLDKFLKQRKRLGRLIFVRVTDIGTG
jgi:transposase